MLNPKANDVVPLYVNVFVYTTIAFLLLTDSIITYSLDYLLIGIKIKKKLKEF